MLLLRIFLFLFSNIILVVGIVYIGGIFIMVIGLGYKLVVFYFVLVLSVGGWFFIRIFL